MTITAAAAWRDDTRCNGQGIGPAAEPRSPVDNFSAVMEREHDEIPGRTLRPDRSGRRDQAPRMQPSAVSGARAGAGPACRRMCHQNPTGVIPRVESRPRRSALVLSHARVRGVPPGSQARHFCARASVRVHGRGSEPVNLGWSPPLWPDQRPENAGTETPAQLRSAGVKAGRRGSRERPALLIGGRP